MSARATRLIAVLVTVLLRARVASADQEGATTDDPLVQARAALEAGDLPTAEQAADRAVAARPDDGEARLVLGMARFRAGHYPEALEAFDGALHAPHGADAATVEFDRGATLYKMGRFEEAERAFTAAAETEPRMAAVARLNAGLAALDGRDLDRASADARRAAADPRADEIAGPLDDLRREIAAAEDNRARAAARQARAEARRALVAGRAAEAVERYREVLRQAEEWHRSPAERAELLYALGMAELAAGRVIEARVHFDAAAVLNPREGDFLFMAAESAFRLDERLAARSRFEEALAAGVDSDAASRAHTALDMLSPGLRSLGRGVTLDLAAGAGYDSNVAQGDLAHPEVLGGFGGSAFAEASLDLAWRLRLGDHGAAELAYAFDQLAYDRSVLDQFNLQQHALTATVEERLGPWTRVGFMTGGDYLFTGLQDFGGFQHTLFVRPALAVDEGERLSTSAIAEFDDKDVVDPAYAYLAGTRTELTLRQDVGSRHAHGDLAYRYRIEDLPTSEVRTGAMVPGPAGRVLQCDFCKYVIPYSYRSQAALGHVEVDLPHDLSLTVSASVEDRPYSDESYIDPGRQHPKVRHDWRYGAGAALTLGGTRQMTLRYDLLVNRSNIDNTRTPLDYDNKNFTKHVVSLEFAYGWLWAKR